MMKWASAWSAAFLVMCLPVPLAAQSETLTTSSVARPAPQQMRRLVTPPEPAIIYGSAECGRIGSLEVRMQSVSVRCVEGGTFNDERSDRTWPVYSFVFTGVGAHPSNRACHYAEGVDDNDRTDPACELLWELRRHAFREFASRMVDDGVPSRFTAIRRPAQGNTFVFEIISYQQAD